MSTNSKDYYHVLGLPDNASGKEIELAYKRAIQNVLSNRQGKLFWRTQLLLIKEAYNILSDKAKRKEYDLMRRFTTLSQEFQAETADQDSGATLIDIDFVLNSLDTTTIDIDSFLEAFEPTTVDMDSFLKSTGMISETGVDIFTSTDYPFCREYPLCTAPMRCISCPNDASDRYQDTINDESAENARIQEISTLDFPVPDNEEPPQLYYPTDNDTLDNDSEIPFGDDYPDIDSHNEDNPPHDYS